MSTAHVISASLQGLKEQGRDRRSPERTPQRDHIAQLFAASHIHFSALLFATAVILLLIVGWQSRLDRYITPETGIGYWLGIVGAAMMVSLLIYPLRKRYRALHWLGPVRYWFRIHKMLGILGPVFILFHCNFSLGAINSNFSLVCMLLVTLSGLIGRYFYTRIHFGLYGSRVVLEQLMEDRQFAQKHLNAVFRIVPQLRQRLEAFESSALAPAQGLVHSAARLLSMIVHTRVTQLRGRRLILKALSNPAYTSRLGRRERRLLYREGCRYLAVFLDTVRKVAETSFYERLFSFWHVLHVPLFLLMLLTVIFHVMAVHIY
jgi:hypothetical protein